MVEPLRVVSTYQWRAAVVQMQDGSPVALIYVITDYNAFFTDPLNYGVYKFVDIDLLLRNWVDAQDLAFTWQKQVMSDASEVEVPVLGSQRAAYGSFKDMLQILRDHAPASPDLLPEVAYDPQAFQRAWNRLNLNGRQSIPRIPGVVRDVYGSLGAVPGVTPQTGDVRYCVATYTWRAVTVVWDTLSTRVLIFIINDYEDFYHDPLANGVYKWVDRELMRCNWLDRQDLLFMWQKRIMDDATTVEEPILGSQQTAAGTLKDLIQILRDQAPASSELPAVITYDVLAFQRTWERLHLNGRLSIPNIPDSIRDAYGVLGQLPPGVVQTTGEVSRCVDTYTWKAVVVDWAAGNPLVLIYIINNYEDFFINPLANGVFKYIERQLLQRNNVDAADLIFTWQKRWMENGDTDEAPVLGSQKSVFGALADVVKVLQANTP